MIFFNFLSVNIIFSVVGNYRILLCMYRYVFWQLYIFVSQSWPNLGCGDVRTDFWGPELPDTSFCIFKLLGLIHFKDLQWFLRC